MKPFFGANPNELGPDGILAGECRYVVSTGPTMFCAEPQAPGSSYCAAHHKRCHNGFGKDWQALAGMMDSVEQHIQPASSFDRERPETAGVDIELKEGK